MSRTKGTFSLTSNIEPKVGAPLDARTIVKLKTDLTASGTFDYPYKGLTVFVEEENKKYTLIGLDPTVSANWIEESAGVQSDWNEDDTSDLSYIKNKPENLVQDANYVHTDNNYDDTSKGKVDALGTASTKDVPASGDASTTQVVMGNDTRLTDAREASDVYSWAKASTKPSYAANEISGLGTAATADTTTSISQGGTGIPTAGAVWSAIDNLPEPMILKGTLGTGGTITSLPTAAADNEGHTYKVITAGTYAGQAAKVGDFFVSCKPVGASAYEWIWFPSGDESFTDTWRNVKVNGTEKLGTGISSGAVDFVNGTNTTVAFDASGNKISVSVPAVSSSSAGVAPKGAAVSSQSQSTKFLREDGTWAAPSYTTNTDRYVNSAAFAHDSTNDNIKMTLTRAGSDSATVTSNIPKVSSSSAGVAPKGATVSSQSQSTKFLREDGTWAAPSYTTNTDSNVVQTNLANTDTNSRRLLLSNSANDTSETKGVYKNTQLQYTPSTGTLTLPKVNQKILQLAKTGTGTAAQDKGSGVSPRYFPSRWAFDFGYAPSDGDIITITIPVASHTWGNWLSIDNGTTYYPVNINYGTTRLTTHFGINNIIQLVFDADGSTASMTPVNGADSVNGSTITGGCWRVINFYDSNTDIRPSAYCDTAAATAAKAASCTNYNLLSKSYLHVLMVYANSSASAITLNVNSKGAKPIYINGTASSASNYTLPAGTYLVYYDGTNYYFRTDGKITGDITGNAATVNGLTVQTAVPANAVFTDTNTKVTQTNSTGNAAYRLLLSANANDTTETNTSYKSTNFQANPSTGALTAKKYLGTYQNLTKTGTGTAAQDKGSGVSPRYFPAKWTLNLGITAAEGDIITFTVPVAGHTYGVFLSVNNGTNYYPVNVNNLSRLTTQFPVGTTIQVVFDADGTTNDMFALNGGDARTNISGGCWRVVNFYDSNSTYNFSGTTFYSGNSSTAEHNADNALKNGNYYYTSNGPGTDIGASTADAALYVQSYSDSWVGQIAQDYRDGDLFVRGKNNGTWQPWKKILDYVDAAGFNYSPVLNFKFNPGTRKIIAAKSTSAWDSQVYSLHGYTDNVYLTFKPAQTNMAIMIGIDSNPTQDVNYTNIDYCWYIQNNGNANIYESGSSVVSCGAYAVGNEFRIEYSGGKVRYYMNGVLKREVAKAYAVGTKYYMDSSFHGASGSVYDVDFGQFQYNAATVNGLTVQTAVPANAVFTDAKVTQTATTTDAAYEVLFSATADNTTRTEGARKTSTLRFNPSKGALMEGSSTTASGSYSHAEGQSTAASGNSSHAEGYKTTASGDYTHSEGYQTSAVASYSHAEGYQTSAVTTFSHAEGNQTRSSGSASHSEGQQTTASGYYSHSEGYQTAATSTASHAEGQQTTASGVEGSHAEGNGTSASGANSHAEGYRTAASGNSSHAEGVFTTAANNDSHAEGRQTNASAIHSHAEGYQTAASSTASHAEGISTIASGSYSHAEGQSTAASGNSSHAEGYLTTAYGNYSHAEGSQTSAVNYAHAEGYSTTASGTMAHSEGRQTTASCSMSHAMGHLNAAMTTGANYSNTTGTAFVIGNGTATTALKNAFSVQFNGTVKAASTITASTTADYAEYFEWADENPNVEDRVGYFVTFDNGDKIRFATSEDDYILGVTSGEPFVLGNGDCDVWNGMVLRDEFRRVIYEPAPAMEDVEGGGRIPKLDKNGNQIYEGTRPKLNPDYDPTKPYVNRADRPEWCPVGMLGVLAVRDDGTCEVNGYATVRDDATATKYTGQSQNKYRVIRRNTQNVVEIVFR